MSITGHNNNNKFHKKTFHRRNNSGELDVFEAAKYFSGGAADQIQNPVPHFPDTRQKNIPTRMSLDLPIMRSVPITPPDRFHDIPRQPAEKSKKLHKHQPSSPGGRLASFLNSLFNQSSLRKKTKPGEDNPGKDETTSAGGRRKRRSSVSHFRIITSSAAAGDHSKKSGFRTPPSYADTPTKSSFFPGRKGGNLRTTLRDEMCNEEKCSRANLPGKCYYEKSMDSSWGLEERGFRKFVVDADGDSDSSSDLFDLPSHELDFYSSGLPVYETTHVDRININVAPVSRATAV